MRAVTREQSDERRGHLNSMSFKGIPISTKELKRSLGEFNAAQIELLTKNSKHLPKNLQLLSATRRCLPGEVVAISCRLTTITWNYESQPTLYQFPVGTRATYQYNAVNRRVKEEA